MKPRSKIIIAPLVLALAGSGVALLGGCEEAWESNGDLEPSQPYQSPPQPPGPAPEPMAPDESEGDLMTEPESEPEPEPEPLMPPVDSQEPESDSAQDEPAADDSELETTQ